MPDFKITKEWVELFEGYEIPVITLQGSEGPTVGITALIHGNEINGMGIIQNLTKKINLSKLRGKIVMLPLINTKGFFERVRFLDGTDINHFFPGKKKGLIHDQICYNLWNKYVKDFNYLIDLHTVDTGRSNSFYVKADLNHELSRKMSVLLDPTLIQHSVPSNYTLRGICNSNNIPAITVEAGNADSFQKNIIRKTTTGIIDLMSYFNIYDAKSHKSEKYPVFCKNSVRISTKKKGLLEIFCGVETFVTKGEKIAVVRDIFGEILEEFFMPFDGFVIGKMDTVVCNEGDQILHVGEGHVKKEWLTL